MTDDQNENPFKPETPPTASEPGEARSGAPQRRHLELVRRGRRYRRLLGEVLLEERLISQTQLDTALEEKTRLKEPLGQVLIRLNFITEEAMKQALASQLNIPFLDLNQVTVDKALGKLINASYARRNVVVPVSHVGQALTIALDDPTNQPLIDELVKTTGRVITVVTATRDAIRRAHDRLYSSEGVRPTESATGQNPAVETLMLAEEGPPQARKSKYVEDFKDDQEASEIVRRIMSVGIEHGCSDIHIESLADKVQVRFRADGILREMDLGYEHLGSGVARRVISRIKILASLDVSERRRPQDGSFRIRVNRKGQEAAVDFRVSVVPGYMGEGVVLRILDRANAPRTIEQLGFSAEVTSRLGQILKRPSGLILVTGPTGSGKTSTLYASLMTMYRPELRVLTAENPIEYVYEQFSQSEVNERIGNTFGSYLRSFLRHDPDVIMVGEVRDEDTASMVMSAAQTGHLVLSTLHTTTASGVVSRLRDLGVDSNLIASELVGVLSQRLLREVCQGCRAPYSPPDELMREFFVTPPDAQWLSGRGCAACHHTGFKGRMPVAELWTPSEQDVVLISKGAPIDEIRASSRQSTISMANDVMARLIAGRTTLEELIRVLPYEHVTEFRRQHEGRQSASGQSARFAS